MKGGDLAMKKVLIVLMIFALCICNLSVFADNNSTISQYADITPFNIAITTSLNKFDISTAGEAYCMGKTITTSTYKAHTTVELQQYTKSWTKFTSWSATSSTKIMQLEKNYYVDKGYSYRLKVTHKAYDSNGKTVETIVTYSDVVKY